ncbi:MAG: TIGR00282 family metallophosphoesterase [Planctomycetota bacterium]
MEIRILAVGDIVGRPGRDLLLERLPDFVRDHDIDFTIANAENAAAGSGVTPGILSDLFTAGIDVITTGDHVWRRREVIPRLEKDERVLRAANFKRGTPGRGYTVQPCRKGVEIGVVHLIGRVYMGPIDCPFAAADEALREMGQRTRVLVAEIHAEATSEKVAMGYYLDGRVSVVFGTHTHVPTADIGLLPNGTAYVTDLGMTGPYRSILGRRIDRVLHRFVTGMPAPFDVATEDVRAGMAIFTVDPSSGRALAAERVEIRAQG